MMLTLMLIGILALGVNFSLRRVSVNIAERSSGVVVRPATDEGDGEDQLFSSSPYERSWDFDRASEWGNFTNANDNSMEIVIGIDHAEPSSYERSRRFITKNEAKFVNDVSMNGKVIALVADVPIAKVAAFSEDVKAAGFSRYIEPNLKFQASFIPNDPYWPQQWGTAKIDADWAWNTTKGDSSILVAVIDTGVDWNHPDLAGNYDASGYDWVNMDDDPMDDSGHGTHCTGVIAAMINNGMGIAGLAQVRVMAEKSLDQFGVGYADELANAVIHATNQSADIISMSWGGSYYSELVYEALRYAYDSEVLLIASAGNEAAYLKAYPAAYKEVVAVTATDQNDDPASFTNYGDWVEVAAPGVDIYSTVWDDSYVSKSGTSMSSAHVAGVAALIWSQFPNVTRDWIRAQLRYTADDLGDPGFDEYYGYGRINARRAVEKAPPDHDLLIFDLETPQFLQLNDTTKVGTEMINFGATDESNVAIQLFVNGSVVNSTVVIFMESGVLATLSFSWTPTTEGIYNVTAYVMPVQNEIITGNNVLSKSVAVRTLRVPEKYPTIQEAINVAFRGESIFVSSGVYFENVVVNKTVSLIGENKSNTVIDGNGTGIVVKVVAHCVNVGGFTIQNGDFAGVAVYSGHSTITDNMIRANNENGVLLSSDSISTIANNTIMKNINGILIENVWYGSYICGNVVTNNTNGIVFRESMHLVLRGNKLSNNFYNLMVEPAWLINPPWEHEYFHDIDISNTVDGKPVYYWINEHDKQVPADAGYVALINCRCITVENLTLTRNSQGVLLVLTTNSTIRNVKASNNFWCGISLEFYSNGNSVIRNCADHTNECGYAGILLAWYSNQNEIVNNTITYGACGIVVRLNSSENQIIGNTVLNNKWTGISVRSSGNVLRCNNMTNNTYNFELGSFIQDIDISNTVNGKPIYYWINQHDKQLPPDAGYIAIINSTGITVKNLNLTNNHQGVLIVYSKGTLIDDVNISTVSCGIRIYCSHHNTVSNDIISNGGKGISLEFSNNNAITDTAILNSSFGVFLEESSDNLISGNTLAASYSDIYIATSHNNRICQNSISKSRYAISIGGSSQNNTIEANSITDNYIGVSIYDSYNNTIICNTIMLNSYYGIYFCRSNTNVIYHNNFIDNSGEVFYREGNILDDGYPSGGNYWSDYTGVDEKSGPNQDQPGSDGIGDTPYTVFPYGADRYPLMSPWTMIHDIAIVNLTFSIEDPKIYEPLHIYVTLQNRGNSTETFNVSVNYTRLWDPLIGTQNVTLEPGAMVTLDFTWTPTTSGRYEIKAYTSTIPNDTTPSDNTKTSQLYVTSNSTGGIGGGRRVVC